MCTDYLIFFTSADQRDNQSSSKTDELRIDKVEIDPLGTIYSKRSTFFFHIADISSRSGSIDNKRVSI